MHARFVLLIALALLVSGCVGSGDPLVQNEAPDAPDTDGITRVEQRDQLRFNTSGEWSHVLEPGSFDILDPLSLHVPVELPIDEGGAGLTGDASVHMGLWLPNIPGCDWDAAEVPAECQVPVVADVGPYYGDGDVPATEPAQRLGGFLIENLVPHGYAVAQVSVLGSGQSNHCMDLMGLSEQLGIDAAVTSLGEAAWSNGNVGLIGRSYDGSTPWEAATFGNPHLKTIAPISGLIGMHELMWRNGSAEFRAPIMHNLVYGTFNIDSVDVNPFAPLFGDPADTVTVNELDPNDAHTACKDYALGPVQGLGAYLTGDHFAPRVNDYWSERYFLDRALENYEGSVYFIHGLQDWNVDPHMAFPTYWKLQEAGLEVKGLFGQWAHDYPDRLEEHEQCDGAEERCHPPQSVRYDWAQDLLEWFDHYLKGTGEQPQLHVEVQDDQGHWRIEETYPPRDAQRHELTLDQGSEPRETTVGPSRAPIVITFDPVSQTQDTRIAGLAHLHATVTPTGPGGQLFAQLNDAETGKRLGHAVMDLRFHDGGKEMGTVTPGETILAKMEFQAMDVVLPAGHGLELVLNNAGAGYLPSAVSSPVELDLEESVLRLPLIERTPEVFFAPPGVSYDDGEDGAE